MLPKVIASISEMSETTGYLIIPEGIVVCEITFQSEESQMHMTVFNVSL